MSEREEGFYWVKYLGGWFPGLYTNGLKPAWYLAGYSNTFQDSDLDEIGRKMEAPDCPQLAMAS